MIVGLYFMFIELDLLGLEIGDRYLKGCLGEFLVGGYLKIIILVRINYYLEFVLLFVIFGLD